ncbi:MAG: DUF1801 domain-containing protein [Litoreibacter sp.]
MSSPHAFHSSAVADKFETFPEDARVGLLTLRELIFDVAAAHPEVGPIEETLKWGQPSYLTPKTKSGSTIRLGAPKTGGFGIYTHCQTTIMSDFQHLFPSDFSYEGNRAVHFAPDAIVDKDKLRLLIASALTYHLK